MVTPRSPDEVLHSTSVIRIAVWIAAALLAVFVYWAVRAEVAELGAPEGAPLDGRRQPRAGRPGEYTF